VNPIDRDGIEDGFEIELIQKISKSVNVPVIAAGGAGKVGHIVDVCKQTECDAVAIRSNLHYKRDDVIRIKSFMKNSGLEVKL
jgi:imidazole glycerol-phosphate synthase subunit HisF